MNFPGKVERQPRATVHGPHPANAASGFGDGPAVKQIEAIVIATDFEGDR